MPSLPPGLAEALLESDAAYFEAGARVESLPGASLAWMEGLIELSAAGVIQRVEPGLGGLPPEEWLATAEAVVRGTGRSMMRLYLTTPRPELEALLRKRGYEDRVELGFLRAGGPRSTGAPHRKVTLHPISSEHDWRAKHAVHEAWPSGPDGHRASADEWVALERRKTEAGYLRPYLAFTDGEVCGSFGIARQGALHRLKNLVLHPSWCHRGVGKGLLESILGDLPAVEALGCLAVEHGEGAALYPKCGFVTVTRQTEWIRRD